MIGFEQVPSFVPGFSLERLSPEECVLLGDTEHVVFRGRNVVEVASLVDRRRTKRELLMLAAPALGELPALAAFYELEHSGKLVALPAGVPLETLELRHALGIEPAPGFDEAGALHVSVHALGLDDGTELDALEQALRGAGLVLADRASAAATEADRPSAALEVWLVDDYLNPELDRLNRERLATGRAWLPIRLSASGGWIGPVFRPRLGPCWQCLAERLRRNRPVEELVRASRGAGTRGRRPPPSAVSRQLVSALGSVVAAQAVASAERAPAEHLLTFELRKLAFERHFVARRPQCPACGEPDLLRARAERPPELSPITKFTPHEGGYRHLDAGAALERYGRLVGPHVGAVSFVEPMPGRPSRLEAVYVSGYPASAASGKLEETTRVCAGKGRSHAQARMSALSEAVERRSGEYDGDEPRVRASAAELGESAFDPALLHGFSARQYAERASPRASTRDRAERVPEPLAPHTELDWTPVWSLSEPKLRYVPLSYCYSGAPAGAGEAYCPTNGNGVAAGTCLEEAILQGLLELVERDAVAIWWYNMLPRPPFDLRDVRDPYLDALLEQHRQRGVEVWTLDLTHDLGIPVCAALRHDGRGTFAFGFGCHLDRELAVQRALTELNQLGDGKHPITGKPMLDTKGLPDRLFLFPARAEHAPRAPASFCGPHLAADVEECVHRLARRELEVFVADKTRPDFELSVAQVIVPGLRHFWPRFGPGRLYSVPVKLGWLPEPHLESSLNPVPLLL